MNSKGHGHSAQCPVWIFNISISFSVESKICCRYTQDTEYSCLQYDDRDQISRIHKEMQLKYYVSGIDMHMKLWWPGFFFPTGHPKPEHSGSGKPDRFHRKPVKSQYKFKSSSAFGNQPVWPVYRSVWPVYRSVWLVISQIQFFFFFCLNSNARKVY